MTFDEQISKFAEPFYIAGHSGQLAFDVNSFARALLAQSDKQDQTQLATQLPGYRAGFKQGYIEGHAEGVFDESERRADAEPVAQIVGDDKTRRLIWRCNAFDYDVGTELYALDKGASK